MPGRRPPSSDSGRPPPRLFVRRRRHRRHPIPCVFGMYRDSATSFVGTCCSGICIRVFIVTVVVI